MQFPGVDFSAFRPSPTIHLSVEGRWLYHMIERVGVKGSAGPGVQILSQPQFCCFVSAWASGEKIPSLPGREEVAGVPHYLNSSVGTYLTLSLSLTTSHGRHCGRVSQDSLSCWLFFVFKSPEYLFQTIGPPSRWHLAVALWDKGKNRMYFFMEATLSHWSSHCLTNPPLDLKLAVGVGLSCS
jgi:hypothetical protein